MTDAGEEQTQIVVDLGDRAHRRARIVRRALLVNRDGRREAVDVVDVRLIHLPEKLPRIGGERLDVAPLPLGKDGVEGQAALPRTGEPGDDDQFIARDDDIDILEVMLARTAHDDSIL